MERVVLISRWSAPLCRPPVRAGIRVSQELVGQNIFSWILFVKSWKGFVGWMNILVGNGAEGLRRFRLFFLGVLRTCPLLGENWRVNWQDKGTWTDVVSVDLFESVITFSRERLKEGATSLYCLSAGISPSESVTLRKTIHNALCCLSLGLHKHARPWNGL